jgi:hypothetical protein
MTALHRPAPPLAAHPGALAVVAVGMAALLARPLAADMVSDPTAALIVLFVALGLAGALWPLPRGLETATVSANAFRVAPAAALALGVAAFAVGRLLGAGPLLDAAPPIAPLLLNGLAAVAEEAFFRRLLYGLLSPWGRDVAVIGSAVAFAAVHVTVWGPAVLPLDLAAGLILSWQRAATGRWTVPAATHVAANVLGAV